MQMTKMTRIFSTLRNIRRRKRNIKRGVMQVLIRKAGKRRLEKISINLRMKRIKDTEVPSSKRMSKNPSPTPMLLSRNGTRSLSLKLLVVP